MIKYIMLWAVLSYASLTGAVDAQSSRILSVEQATVASTKPPSQAYTITATLSNADGVYSIGEQIDLSVRLNKAAYLLVVNVDEAGRVAQLFPNKFNEDNYVPADTELLLPGPGARIVAAGPAGTELIKIIATERPLTIDDVSVSAPVGPFKVAPPGSGSRLSRALGVVNTGPASGSDESPEDVGEGAEPGDGSDGAGGDVSDVGRWGEFTVLLSTVAAEESYLSPDISRREIRLTARIPELD
ncbi:DUF4384 domain-containing protein [uncultured Roseobacter sp.]|uniref:DUF4384 domain-containing protein n=1 Tax=uncultured Roseobacter sp. TaxID=114847 RepID=UPI00261723F0|nr:DUF4384 domain-containing protein [uncultured Roseobacter sp.]